MKHNLYIALFFACALTVCAVGHSNATGSKAVSDILKLEESGDIPRLERGDSLVGTDMDGNGIRDDIDAYINQHYSGEERRSAARQFARYMQATLLVPESDREAARAVSLQGTNRINCMYSIFGVDAAKAIEDIIAITTNTKSRLRAYLTYDKMLDGMVFVLPKGDGCE